MTPIQALLFLAVYVTSGDDARCRCREDVALADSYQRADVVVLGTVTKRERTQELFHGDMGPYPAVRVRLVVGTAWKGAAAQDTLTITTGVGGGDCGFPFELVESYLVFAKRNADGVAMTGICYPTRHARNAHDEIAWLRSRGRGS